MTALTCHAPVAARFLLGLLFVVAGAGKLSDPAGFAGDMASGGVPGVLAWPVILFEIALGLATITGFRARAFALAGAAFTVAAAVLYHFRPSDPMQMTQFLKNLAIAGGFLMVAAHGPGRPALGAA